LDIPISQMPGGVRLKLLVQPCSSISEVTGVHDGRLKVRLAAPPVDGAANEALLKFLAKGLGVPRAGVEITSGAKGRRKTVTVLGISVGQATSALLSNR
jgi:uncharacterized protein (TIGR00251 family)